MVEDTGKTYYEKCKAKGLDYNYYGNWQDQYGKFVVSVSNILPKLQKERIRLLDAGCACGVNLKGIKNTGVFREIVGIDASPYLINLGRATHGYKETELFPLNILQIPEFFEKETFEMVHCTQVLEHVEEYQIPEVLKAFHHVLVPGGVLFLVVDAVSPGQTEQELRDKDETHVTIRPRKWYSDQVAKQFRIDPEAHQRFQRTKFSPDNSTKTFYDYYQSQWALIIATKK